MMRSEYPGVRNSFGKLEEDVDGLSNLLYTFMCSHDNPTEDTELEAACGVLLF